VNILTIILYASPRADGYTARTMAEYIKNCHDQVKIFDAFRINAKPCIGCGRCADGFCHYHDLDYLFAQIIEADTLVIATPIYNFNVPSPLKAIFDRMQPFYEKPLTDKKLNVDILFSCGRSGEESTKYTTRMIDCIIKNLGGKIRDIKITNFTDDRND